MDLYTIQNELMKGKSIFDLNLKVTFYTRVSTSSDEQLNSLKNQFTYYEEFIKSKSNWKYSTGYIDKGLSGTSTQKREEFRRMIEDAKCGRFDLILTKEVSRFARNTLDSLYYTRELLKYNVGVFFENDNINTFMKDSELRLTIMASMAQDESRKISERVKWGYKRSVEAGHVHANNRMWGYNLSGSGVSLVINEKEACLVKRIFELYIDGSGMRKIARIISEEGYRNRNKRPFSITSIKNIITNPRYKGYYTGRKQETINFISKKIKKFDKNEWVMYYAPDKVPPIVSCEEWDEANRMLECKSRKMKSEEKTSYQNKFLYSGKIYCKIHNAPYWRSMYRYKNSKDKEIWQCSIYRKKGKEKCTSPPVYKDEIDAVMKSIIKEIFILNKNVIKSSLGLYSFILNTNYKMKNSEISSCIENLKVVINKNYGENSMIDDKTIDDFLEKIVVYDEIKDNHIVYMDVYIRNFKPCRVLILRKMLSIGNVKNRSLILIRHFIRADVETEISPIMGTEKESEEMVNSLLEQFESDPSKLWQSNMFGKSLEVLVKEGLQNKLYRMPEDIQRKLQKTLQKIINEGSSNLICIIL